MIRTVLVWFDARRLATAILFVALFAMAVRTPADTDTWWHLQAGRVTLESGHILQKDPFSFTRAGAPWVNHSWLSQVILYWLFARLSYAGLGLWMGVVVVAAFVFIYLQMEGDPFTRAFILILAAATSAVVWIARPQLLSLLCMAVVGYVLHLFKWRRLNRLWLLPPLFVLWVNLHAGYALGFMLLLAFVAGEVVNHLLSRVAPSDDPIVGWKGIGMVAGVTLLSAILLVLNPNTTRMWTYPLETVRIGVLQDYIQEWQSPNFHPLYAQPFIWLLLAILAATGLSGRRMDGTDLAMVGVFAYAALLAARNFGPFALVAAPILSRHVVVLLRRFLSTSRIGALARSSRPLQPRLRAVLGAANICILTMVVGLAVWKVSIPLGPADNEFQQRRTLPVGAVEWIEQHQPAGRMFNHYNWGGYLIWRLWPAYQVFTDGRTDLYGDGILRDYVEIQTAGPRAISLLASYDISFVVTKSDDVLSTLLSCQEDWSAAYQDDVATIWTRFRE